MIGSSLSVGSTILPALVEALESVLGIRPVLVFGLAEFAPFFFGPNQFTGGAISRQSVPQSRSSTASLDIGDESEGSQKFFHLIGPILDILENSNILAVDELGALASAIDTRYRADVQHP